MPSLQLPWKAQSQRCTLFRVPGADVNAENEWAAIAGSEPTDIRRKPAIGVSIATGPHANGLLTVRVEPTRFEISLAPAQNDEPQLDIPTLGPLEEVATTFEAIIQRWIPRAPPVTRIAYGLIATLEVQSKVDGYQKLQTLLPAIQLDVENSSDFFYQINRPRQSTVISDLDINRLSKWAIQRIATSLTELRGADIPLTSELVREYFQCSLDLDVNTTQQWQRELTNAELPTVFLELRRLALEIAYQGDIR